MAQLHRSILSMFLAVPLIATGTSITPIPTIPLRDYDLKVGNNVRRFNGSFIERLGSMGAPQQNTSCILSSATITVGIYRSGDIAIMDRPQCFPKTPNSDAVADLTSSVQMPSVYLVALAAAERDFISAPLFATNDHNLSDYDFEVYERDGKIRVLLLPVVAGGLVLGCPKTGPLAVPYIMDPATLDLKIGHMVC